MALYYRRGAANRSGTWAARIRGEAGKYALRALGVADDYRPADGERVLTYRQASAKAVEEAERGPAPSYTVANAKQV